MTLWKKDDSPSPELDQDEIESTFDIMLCDYCDAEFYSDEAFTVSFLGFWGLRGVVKLRHTLGVGGMGVRLAKVRKFTDNAR